MIAALFIDPAGPYPSLGCDCWDEERDARNYEGPYPVVAHPPCQRWCKLAKSVEVRLGPKYAVGCDGGCFESAVKSVQTYGGVLEHPAQTSAFTKFNLPNPKEIGWTKFNKGWVCEVWQSAYGHLANKATWLYYYGNSTPFELDWSRPQGTHVVGYDSKSLKKMVNPKPRLTRQQAIHTPLEFAKVLISLAELSQKQ